MDHEEAARAASKDGAVDGLSDHPQAVYTPPPTLDKALADLPLVEVDANAPKRIGYLTNYSFHIWYQILIEIIKRRAAQYGATVIVREIRSRKVFVLGQVTKQGPVPLNTDMTVLQVLSVSGGLLEYADKDNILVIRKENGRERRFKSGPPLG